MLFKCFSRLLHSTALVTFLLIFSYVFTPILVEAGPIPNVFINEIHYDNNGADQNEFIELAVIEGLNLSGWSLHFYNGSDGEVYKKYNFTDWFFNNTINGFGFAAVYISGIQNGPPDGIVLSDAKNNIVQFLSYEGSFTASSGIASGLTSTNIEVFESNQTSKNFSLQLKGQGQEYNDFSWGMPQKSTFGDANVDQNFIIDQNAIFQVSEPSSLLLFYFALVIMFFRYFKQSSKIKSPDVTDQIRGSVSKGF